jgi:hypothetical protein
MDQERRENIHLDTKEKDQLSTGRNESKWVGSKLTSQLELRQDSSSQHMILPPIPCNALELDTMKRENRNLGVGEHVNA